MYTFVDPGEHLTHDRAIRLTHQPPRQPGFPLRTTHQAAQATNVDTVAMLPEWLWSGMDTYHLELMCTRLMTSEDHAL